MAGDACRREHGAVILRHRTSFTAPNRRRGMLDAGIRRRHHLDIVGDHEPGALLQPAIDGADAPVAAAAPDAAPPAPEAALRTQDRRSAAG